MSMSSEQKQTEPNLIAERDAADERESTSRLEAFSDGVFAIAITLLVLDIHVPDFKALTDNHQSLLSYLGEQWPVYLAYLTSFMIIGIIWINHHIVFKYIKRSNRTLLNINLLLLLATSFIPFPTELLGEAIKAGYDMNTAAAVYSGTLLVMGAAFAWLWAYASRGHRLIDKAVPEAMLKSRERANLLGVSSYFIAFIFAFISVQVTIGLTVLVALLFFLPSRAERF